MKTLITVVLTTLSFVVLAQPGKVDTTFNAFPYSSYGTGNGSNGCPITYAPIRKLLQQPDGKTIVAGDFCQYNGVPNFGIVRLNQDGSLDHSFNAGTTFEYNTGYYFFTALALQNDGKIIAIRSEYNGASISIIRRLNADGSLDTNDIIQGEIYAGIIHEAVFQPDGKLILCGDFTYRDTDFSLHYNIVRINPDGSRDNTFTSGAFDFMQYGKIEDLKLDSQGKLLIAGGFNSFNGVASKGFVRLNTDGTIDQTLNMGSGFNDAVKDIVVQPDNKLLLSGDFGLYQGSWTGCVIRLQPDGSLDGSFLLSPGIFTYVNHLNLLSDNRIVFIGSCSSPSLNQGFIRLHSDGSLDTTANIGITSLSPESINDVQILSSGKLIIIGYFHGCQNKYRGGIAQLDTNFQLDLSFGMKPGFSSEDIHHTLVQPDGKILVGKKLNYESDMYQAYNDMLVKGLLRLNTDGTLDTTFQLADSLFVSASAMARQSDGKIIVAGKTKWVGGDQLIGQGNIARFNPDGSIDSSFQINNFSMYSINEVLFQPDGKIIVLGYFTPVSGGPLNHIARFNTDGTFDNTFNAGTGPNGEILCGAITTSGKIIIGGSFNTYNGTPFVQFGALNSDGSIDPTFDFNGHIFTDPWSIKTQSDGKILIAAESMADQNNLSRVFLRLNPNGNIDPNFVVNDSWAAFGDNVVLDLMPLPNGKLLIGGEFNILENQSAAGIVRVNQDGSRDFSFHSQYIVNEPYPSVKSIALGLDGKVVIGGKFSKVALKPANGIAVLQHDLNDYFTVSFTNVVNDSCVGDGTATAFAFGGTPPYEYTWEGVNNPNDSSQVFTESGIYTCAVQDADGLIYSASLLIDAPTTQNGFDLKANLVAGSFRTGFDNTIAINALNDGCMPTSGQLMCVLDSLVNFNSAIPAPTFQNNDTLIWNFNNLTYDSGYLSPIIQCTVSANAQIGDSVKLFLYMTPFSGDADSLNNSKTYTFPIINGYDPNIKSVYPVGKCEEAYIENGQKLTYTVQFQNTGNAEAINIVVVDSLNENLDINSLHIVGNSHDVWAEIEHNNTVKFHFDAIYLPDSATNESASHGHVIFEIDPISTNLAHNTVISNKAEIYFDFNPAIITNTCSNTIFAGDLDQYVCNEENLGLDESTAENEIAIYPNPTRDFITIHSNDGLNEQLEVLLTDLTGKLILMTLLKHNTDLNLDLSSLDKGTYILMIKNPLSGTFIQNSRIVKI